MIVLKRDCCDVCGSYKAEKVTRYSPSDWSLVRCVDCSFVYLGTVPDYELLNEEFAFEKTFEVEKTRRNKRVLGKLDKITRFRTSLGKLFDNRMHSKSYPNGSHCLEIGCGSGSRAPDGMIPFGIDVSAELARRATEVYQRKGGYVVHAPATEGIDVFSDTFFDLIIMRSYLEHERQPRLILERSFQKLKPGGKIVFRLPNFGSVNRLIMGKSWCGFRFPDHVNYFTPKTLGQLSKSVGFEFSWENWYSPFDDNIVGYLSKPI